MISYCRALLTFSSVSKNKFSFLWITVALGTLASAPPAAAQPFESSGVRAQGMGGAFVAVADDASATWWNPAGLPGILIVDGVFEWQTTRLNSPADRPIEDVSAAGKGQAATR